MIKRQCPRCGRKLVRAGPLCYRCNPPPDPTVDVECPVCHQTRKVYQYAVHALNYTGMCGRCSKKLHGGVPVLSATEHLPYPQSIAGPNGCTLVPGHGRCAEYGDCPHSGECLDLTAATGWEGWGKG